MKTKVRKSNRSKKAAKVRRSSSAADANVRPLRGTIHREPSKHGPDFWTKWKLSDLLALLSFGLEPDHVAPKVNRRKREAGLTEPAALPVANPVSNEHPRLRWITVSELSEIKYDPAVLAYRYCRLFAWLAAGQSELEARVTVAESRLDSLLHDQPQVPHIDKSSVPAGFFAGTPFYEVSGDLPADLTGGGDATLPKKGAESVPGVPGPLKGEGAAGVPLGQEAGNPDDESFWPRFCAYYAGSTFHSGSPVPEPSRFTRLVRQCVAKARRVLNSAAMFVTEL